MKTQNTLKTSIIAALIIVMAAATSSNAQTEQTETIRNSLTAGSWSMQFRIGENFTLSSFEGSTISLKKHFTDKSALRLGLSVSHSDSENERDESKIGDTEYSYENSDNDYSVVTTYNQKGFISNSSETNVRLSATYLYYIAPSRKINTFFGVGPVVSYANRHYSGSSTYPPRNSDSLSYSSWEQYGENNRKTWTYGAQLVFGAEWFASSSISFMAEYSLGASYASTAFESHTTTQQDQVNYSQSRTTSTSSDSKTTKDGFSVSSSRVKFGISVYF